jgi:hypothetical protein
MVCLSVAAGLDGLTAFRFLDCGVFCAVENNTLHVINRKNRKNLMALFFNTVNE